MSGSKVKVAAIQAARVFLDLEASLQKALALMEKAAANGASTAARVYNTILYFDADGRLLGKHRKLMPTHAERLVWGMGTAPTCASTRPGWVGWAG